MGPVGMAQNQGEFKMLVQSRPSLWFSGSWFSVPQTESIPCSTSCIKTVR